MLSEARIVLADEPIAALDRENSDNVVDLLAQHARSGTTVVVATHDPLVAAAADRVYALSSGAIVRELSSPSRAELGSVMMPG
ncbi:hypothetical protein Rrhod_2282 [Rhodococcus rhodnii LMG 5362]|uniref:Uncharacterized protein n=1 Tax=Rhodococcus rhodnii LMG 5362 TaxID=1273125 RepID=R7WM11_9NOCA|nr:hypothetical protein Rrhod_2282 [Rhodococcus rhodnii LMG 5362]